ncbi:MAG: AhpC/TSA family protein [Rhodoblastus sp.]|nr:AhpC/TSA family protein [Rhodoblastus sp.]
MPQYATLPEALAGILAQDMTMSEALAAFASELERLKPAIAKANVALIERLRAVQAGVGAPAIGETLPHFILPDENGSLRALDEFTSRGPVVVSIVRGHWCPFCYIETSALAKALPALERSGASVVVIMPEKQGYARIVRDRSALAPVLSDMDCAYSMSIGLCFYIGDEIKNIFQETGNRLPAFQGLDSWFLPMPATFVLDRSGVVVERMVDPDFRLKRLSIARIMAAIDRAKSTGAG